MGFQGRCLGKFVLGNSRLVPGGGERGEFGSAIQVGEGGAVGNLNDKFTGNFKKRRKGETC